MSRLRLLGLPLLVVLLGVVAASPADAATDPSSTALACSPASPGTGAATICTVTVSDTTGGFIPTGTVVLTAAPSSGTFGGAPCALQPTGAAGATATCTETFTPTAGGSYTITAAYGGDGNEKPSTGTFSLTAIDATTTSLSCSDTTVSISTSTSCTATLADAGSRQSPLGTVTFSSSPGSGTFSAPGICQWHPSGAGGSATCSVTFAPAAAGPYRLSASYSGDSDHLASAGSFSLTATTTPTGGGPGSHPGTGSVTIPISTPGGPPAAGSLVIGGRAKVSSRHTAAVKLSCSGATGATCAGTLRLTTKVKVKAKRKRHAKKHKKSKFKTITIGKVRYSLAAGTSHTVSVKLSKPGVKLLAKARHHKLKVKASAANAVTKTVTLTAQKQKKHKHKKKKKK